MKIVCVRAETLFLLAHSDECKQGHCVFCRCCCCCLPQGLLLLQQLTKSNAAIQKIVAFENAFERLLDIITEEGSSDGGTVWLDTVPTATASSYTDSTILTMGGTFI